MKSKKSFIVLLLSLLCFSTNIYARNIKILVDGDELIFKDATPFITSNDRVVLPFRVLGESLNIRFDWKDKTVIATGTNVLTNEFIQVKIKANDYKMYINNQEIIIDETLLIKNDRSYIPIRVFSEAFGYDVIWKDDVVYVNTPKLPEPPEPTPDPVHKLSKFEQDVFTYTNEVRKYHGLKPLELALDVSYAANLKSKEMYDLKYFDHTSPTYGSPANMLQMLGMNYKYVGENIAWGHETPKKLVIGWYNSPGHKANMLNTNYTHFGVGHDPRGNHATQIFIRK